MSNAEGSNSNYKCKGLINFVCSDGTRITGDFSVIGRVTLTRAATIVLSCSHNTEIGRNFSLVSELLYYTTNVYGGPAHTTHSKLLGNFM